ncbi:MAG: hypothetical protein KDB14_22130 [Planctomycetales bacterium]|nr:hypothetical protein [Planctomycetales bacterium]
MLTSPREQLLGYLLGALEADEQATMERELIVNSQLRAELEKLRQHLQPLEWIEREYEPPQGLVARTCQTVMLSSRVRHLGPMEPSGPMGEACEVRWTDVTLSNASVHVESGAIHESVEQHAETSGRLEPLPSESLRHSADAPLQLASREPLGEPLAKGRGWSRLDKIVGVSLCVALLLMLMPSLLQNVAMSRRLQCQTNLKDVGHSLIQFAAAAEDGRFPSIPTTGKRAFVGVVAPTLVSHQMLPRSEALRCPSDDTEFFRVTLEQIELAEGDELEQLRKVALGSMGYNLGVFIDGQYQAPRNQGRARFVLMSEAPRFDGSGNRRPGNHGNGYNMLFEDQHVEFVVGENIPGTHDDPFHNRHGLIEAGIGPNDAVIGPSQTPPYRVVPAIR